MLTHVVRTLSTCPEIGRIIVLGQEPLILADAVMAGGKAEIRSSNEGISMSLKALAQTGDVPWPWLVTTADHPLVTHDMIREFLGKAHGDLSVGMVERQVMLARFHGAKRTWLRFADGAWSGANLFAFANENVTGALSLWAEAEKDRKKIWKLFLHFGLWLAFRAITRTISLSDAFAQAGKRLKMTATLIPLSDPVAAIDIDKISDHILAEQILRDRAIKLQS